MNQLLIVDDDDDIREMLGNYFSREDYHISYASNGQQGLEMVAKFSYDIILLDIMMPEMDGYTMLEKIRLFCQTPVILLTAKGDQISRIKGFTKGCDDYVNKPFDFAELSLRIQAILRRTTTSQRSSQDSLLRVKDLIINQEEHSVKKDGIEIELTNKEYEILCKLASNKGRVYSTKMLYEQIWKEPFLENDKSIITHMRNLREKIGDNIKEGKYIKTIWGAGYKIEKEMEA